MKPSLLGVVTTLSSYATVKNCLKFKLMRMPHGK